jgi:Uma2 family endonuclease
MVALNYYVSPEDYLEGERVSPIKHEYRRGLIYAMVGAKKPHVIIAGNIARSIGNHLAKSPCIVMSSDIKVRLIEANCYYYPDVVVTCHPNDLQGDEDYIHHPTVVIEVLSQSTEKFDRTTKFVDYQTCPELEEYVLISQTEKLVEVRTRQNDRWHTEIYKNGDRIQLKSIDRNGPIDDIYQKVTGLATEESVNL